jgi:lipopolysaccharide transport system ATP-binding protein
MEQIIEFSEVREFIDTPVKRYSSGMFVKLAFSVAAHLDAEIMIMDEVLAVGDMAFQKKCLTKMREAAKQDGRTVLYVSHNMNTIRQLCDRCIVLNKGKVIFEGDVEKAVQVYMGGSSELNHNIIIQPYMRVIDCDSKIRVTSFISSNEDCILPFGNKLSFRLVICSKYDIDKKCYLRAIIHSANGDAVAMCHSNEPIVVNRNADSVHEFEMDISQIVPGDYYLDLVLIDFGDLGAEIRLDSLQYVFRFRINETPNFNLFKNWYSAGWGYFCINCHVLHMENM